MSVAPTLPIIDIAPLATDARDAGRVAEAIAAACVETGFFYVTGHGVQASTLDRLDAAARAFFALPQETKEEIAMTRAGRAWRGYFPLGGELTSGSPDRKEGVYFGQNLDAEHPRVRAGTPLHGANLYPLEPPELKGAVDDFMREATQAAHAVARGVALSLDLDGGYFENNYTADPTVLFRIFHYPPSHDEGWGVGEHTDYGLLTLLAQDDVGGLQVKTARGWVDAPPLPGTLVCNIGDMLDRMTRGRYKSTPHRVRNVSNRQRLSFPLFFDPGWDAIVSPLPGFEAPAQSAGERWDNRDIHAFGDTYGAYLLGKVGKVFPDLGADVLGGS